MARIKSITMTNPFPRAASGSYRPLLVEGLNRIGECSLADEFANGNMRLAVTSSIVGNVKTFRILKDVCINALNAIDDTDVVRYYRWSFEHGECVVASSNVDFIYDPADRSAVALNEAMKKMSESETVNFFTN